MKLEEITRREMLKGLASAMAEPSASNGGWIKVGSYVDSDRGTVDLYIDVNSINKTSSTIVEFRVKKIYKSLTTNILLATYKIDLKDKTISFQVDGRYMESPVGQIKPGTVNNLIYDFVIKHLK